MVTHLRTVVVILAPVVAVVAAVAGPFEVVAGVARLATWVVLAAGASVLIWRTGTVDLATPAAVAAGAYAGGVLVGVQIWPAPLGPVVGALAGAAVGAAAGALAGRVGGRLAALPTLSLTLAAVAVLRAWPGAGGPAGYHAVPFLTGGDRGDAVAAVIVAAGALAVATWWAGRRVAAATSVAVRAPAVGAALGYRPAGLGARAGALAGLLLGLGGALQAMVNGSVSPGAYGLSLAAALALAALLGGQPPLGPLIGALWVWGPSVLFPLAPVVGDAPPLLVTGAAGLGLLVLRRGRALVTSTAPRPPTPVPTPSAAQPGATPGPGEPSEATPRPVVLEVVGGPGWPALTVHRGEVVAVIGPNGVGKSTLLARIGGQLDDHGAVFLHGRPAPRHAVRRARHGLARTWQRPPDVPIADLLAAAGRSALADRLTAALTAAGRSAHDDPAVAQVVAAAAGSPDVVLLDEPASTLPEQAVAAAVRVLADSQVAVVLVDHRPEVVAVADRVITMGESGTTPPRAIAHDDPEGHP
jgi:ABC-type branched-subunit amino acid transport system ATPase component/ABC-type branched-subunit amino acid transport system permease subunit